MASRLSCPHCKSSYRLSAEYNGEMVRCLVCERLFRVRHLLPQDSVPYGIENCARRTVSEEDGLFAEPINESTLRDPTLIPFELIEPPRDGPVLPDAVYDDLLPVNPLAPAVHFEVIEPVAPPVLEPVDDSQPRSLLDSLDLSLPIEPYLPAVEPERRSLLDSLDLTLRKDPTESVPVMLELIEPADASSLDLIEPVLDIEDAFMPTVTLELVEQPVADQPPPAGMNLGDGRAASRLPAGDHQRNGSRPRYERDRYEKRDQRRRPQDGPRRRPMPPPPPNWVSDNKGPILVAAMLLSVIVGAVVVVKVMENRTSPRSSYANEQRRPKRFEPPEWQPNFPGPPPMQPHFPQMDPRFDGPVNDMKKPFAEPPMLEKKPTALEPKKPRKKSTLPQERRDWIELTPRVVSVDAKAGSPQINSKPVELAARGTTYNYLLDIRTSTDGATALLEIGPPGMKLQNDARLLWQVPQNFAEDEIDVTVRVKQPDGKEVVQTFVVSIR